MFGTNWARQLWCKLRRHPDWWLLVDNGGGTRLLQCRTCGRYEREEYPVYTGRDGITRPA